MNIALVAFVLLLPLQDDFNHFSYCHDSFGAYELQCVQLDSRGEGEVRFKRKGADEIKNPIKLSETGRDRYLGVVSATNFLADGKNYESRRKVANLGRKRLSLQTPSGRRETEFNYSELKEVTALVSFFESLISQEIFTFDLQNAIQYDRLSVPKRLDDLEREIKAGRIADPLRLVPVLERIDQDARLVNYARAHARRLKEEISGVAGLDRTR